MTRDGLIRLGPVVVATRTVPVFRDTPLGFASNLQNALNGFERGLLSEEATRSRLRRLGFDAVTADDVIAARRKRIADGKVIT